MGANLLAYGKKVVGLEGEVREWTLLDTVASGTTKTIPNGIKEILVVPNYNDVVSFSTYLLDEYDSSVYRTGYYYNSSTYGYGETIWDKTARTVRVNNLYINGISQSVTVKIYVK